MSEPGAYLWLIPGLPLGAAAIIALVGPRLLGRHSHWPCILAVIGSCLLSFFVLEAVHEGVETVRTYYTWFQVEKVNVGVTLQADALTAFMLLVVTFVGSLIAIYSAGYMHGDPGYPRYFAEIALFIFSMTGLVLADNFLLLYAFWEGVGLCSYLLIGFWFAKPSAAAAARKAFLVTRIGDAAMILGIILVGLTFGTLDFGPVFASVAGGASDGTLAAICLLLFCGAVGKSAQFPLYVWLPDAMEGPSPVSALIHAATMVTAGVYLVARSFPLFHVAPAYVLLVVAAVGAFTCLFAALIAPTQTDLKRVLAYSTVSQIGYMFLALGSGTQALASAAVVAALFHLLTHAFFKALLFLAAGSVMHSMGNVIDMRRFGGLRRLMPLTHWTFFCGAAALAALPPFAGFWSKDAILAVARQAGHSGAGWQSAYPVLFWMGLITAGLTAFYTFRSYFLTFFGPLRFPPEAGAHPHEAPAVMTGPLLVLALGAVALGYVIEPYGHWLSDFLNRHWLEGYRLGAPAEHGHDWLVMVGGSFFGAAGVALAWWLYVADPARERVKRLALAMQGWYQLSLNKFHVDELYYAFIVQPAQGLAVICRWLDQHVVDGIVDLIGFLPRGVGLLLRPIQNGLVQFYALAMLLGLTVFVGALVWRLSQ
jgi:NADH-quinone oxidoreductase subunit L